MTNYPAGVTDADFDDRGAFQGDVSRREVEITISVTASMLNHGVEFAWRSTAIQALEKATKAALIASWHEENDK